jgi:hypothetical protein
VLENVHVGIARCSSSEAFIGVLLGTEDMAKWTHDEVVLTLDLYISSGHRVLEPHHPEMQELVALINRVRAKDESLIDRDPRTGGSIKAKMANLRSLDPTHVSAGWGNVGKLDLEVWNEFADNPVALSQAVAQIRRLANT